MPPKKGHVEETSAHNNMHVPELKVTNNDNMIVKTTKLYRHLIPACIDVQCHTRTYHFSADVFESAHIAIDVLTKELPLF